MKWKRSYAKLTTPFMEKILYLRGVRMKIFNKKEKEKEEIKTLINMLEYCHVYLALELTQVMQDRVVTNDASTKIEEIEALLSNARQRLRELGVY